MIGSSLRLSLSCWLVLTCSKHEISAMVSVGISNKVGLVNNCFLFFLQLSSPAIALLSSAAF